MNTYCGPFVLSYVLGINTDEAAALIKATRSNGKRVTYTYNSEITMVLTRHGRTFRHFCYNDVACVIRVETASGDFWIPRNGLGDTKPTLVQWLKRQNKSKLYIIQLTGHYIVVRGNKIFDTEFPNGVWLRKYTHRRAKVGNGWELERKGK